MEPTLTILTIHGVHINASPTEFQLLNNSITMPDANDISDDFEGVQKVIELRQSGVLFSTSFCLNKFKSNPHARHFCEISDFYSGQVDIIHQRMRLDGSKDYKAYIKRVLATLRLTTSLKNFKNLNREIWEAWIGSMKLPSTQWNSDVSPTEPMKSAFSKIAQFLDLENPQKNYSYIRPVRVIRTEKVVGTNENKGSEFLLNTPPEFAHAKELFDEFTNALGVKSVKPYNRAFCNLADWMEQYPLSERKDLLTFLRQPRKDPSWLEYSKKGYSRHFSSSQGHKIQLMVDFVNWVIETYMTSHDGDEVATLGFPLVDSREQKLLDVEKKYAYRAKPTEAKSTPLPLRYLKKLKQILRDDNWGWPKSLDLHRIERIENGKIISEWNPIFAYLVYGMLELPWRKIQFLSLDSGEGDALEFDKKTLGWVKNKSDHAGYWQRDVRAKRKHRGVVAYDGSPNNGAGFYVNTNKTADIEVGFGEQSGYFTPWQNAEMIELFYELRNWQMTHNPVSGPTSYRDAWIAFHPRSHPPTETIMNQVPDRFYLFRDIQNSERKDIPPTENRINSFWRLLMDELERRLREEGENANIIATRNASGGPLTSYYTMHGLRVAGLTAFAEAGVPIEVLSKLVAGHASILMTLYYVKHSTAHVTEVLSKARLDIESAMSENFKKEIAATSIEQAARIAVAAENYTLEGIANGTTPSDLFFDVGIGICPYAGTRCGDGLQISKDRTGPVPGGARNCLQCRHFVTGLPWLIPLVLNQTKLSAEVQSLCSRSERIDDKLNTLKAERAALVKQGKRDSIPLQLQQSIARLDAEHERLALEIEENISNMHRQHKFIDRIKSLDVPSSDENLPVITSDLSGPSYKEGSRLELIDSIVQGSRIYQFLEDESLEIERQQFIDKIMFRNGMVPLSMLELSDEQRRKAADAASALLLKKYNAVQVDLLISGAETFESLGHDGSEIDAEVRAVLKDGPQALFLVGVSHGE